MANNYTHVAMKSATDLVQFFDVLLSSGLKSSINFCFLFALPLFSCSKYLGGLSVSTVIAVDYKFLKIQGMVMFKMTSQV